VDTTNLSLTVCQLTLKFSPKIRFGMLINVMP